MTTTRQWFKDGRLDEPKVKITVSLHNTHPLEKEILNQLKSLPKGYVSRFLSGLMVKGFVKLAQENGIDIQDALNRANLINSALDAHTFQQVNTVPNDAFIDKPKQPSVNTQNTTPVTSMTSTAHTADDVLPTVTVAKTVEPSMTMQEAVKEEPTGNNKAELSSFLKNKSTYWQQVNSKSDENTPQGEDPFYGMNPDDLHKL